jgi:hypothetical protein
MVLNAALYIGSKTRLRQLLGHRPRGQNIGTGPLRSKTSVAGETRRSAPLTPYTPANSASSDYFLPVFFT